MTAPKEVRDNHEEVMPGVFAGVDIEKYHNRYDGESKTSICWVAKSIKQHLMAKAADPLSGTGITKGKAVHDLAFLPDVYKRDYLVGPTHTKTAKAWKEFVKEHPDKTILTPRESDDVHGMRGALYDNPGMVPYLDSRTVLREVCMWARHPATNILLKIRPDLIADGWIIDLKSTSGDVGFNFRQSVWKYDYYVQHALYTDVASMVGLRIKGFLFFVVGSKPPFLTAIYRLNEDWVNEGRCKYNWALNVLAEYKTSDDPWGGLPRGREVVEL
jgi:hypothetical protein